MGGRVSSKWEQKCYTCGKKVSGCCIDIFEGRNWKLSSMYKLYIWLVIWTKDNEVPKAYMGKIKYYSETCILFCFKFTAFLWVYTVRGATEAEPKFVFMFYDASQLFQTYLYIVYCAHIFYIYHTEAVESHIPYACEYKQRYYTATPAAKLCQCLLRGAIGHLIVFRDILYHRA
jgi:hypothetical protein